METEIIKNDQIPDTGISKIIDLYKENLQQKRKYFEILDQKANEVRRAYYEVAAILNDELRAIQQKMKESQKIISEIIENEHFNLNDLNKDQTAAILWDFCLFDTTFKNSIETSLHSKFMELEHKRKIALDNDNLNEASNCYDKMKEIAKYMRVKMV